MDGFAYLNESARTDHGHGDEDEDDEGSSSNWETSFTHPEDDFYAFMNLPKDASSEDIQNQYRRLSKIYHPDKHSNDPVQKGNAERLFAKLKYIQEVLSDPEKRAIYDTLGAEALQEAQQQGPTGMELVTKYKTPMEIREEFERLQREREEQRMERQANPKGSVTVNINASEIFAKQEEDEDDEYYYKAGPYVELTGFHFTQSIEAPLTLRDTLTMSGSVSADNGRGKGNITGGFRRMFGNRASAEMELGGSTNGIDFGFKGYSLVGSHYHANCQVACQTTAEGIMKPALAASVARQFDAKSNGQLMWRGGGILGGGLQTTYTWDDSITRFVGTVHIGVPHSSVGCTIVRRFEEKKIRVRGSIRAGTFGVMGEYGIEKKVSQLTTLGATLSLGIPIGVSLRIKILRSNQSYIFPIRLCDQVLPAPVVYGTVTPLILWVVVNKLLIQPYERDRKSREKAKLKAQYKTRLAEKKMEAEGAVLLMKNMYNRIVQEEEKRRGLVITSGKYGRLISTEGPVSNDEVIDVTIALQCLVKDSRLILHAGSKSNLPGFYDPIPWEEKSLTIQYLFHDKLHEVSVKDEEAVVLPKGSHAIPEVQASTSSTSPDF